jgi:hypothetical protein
MRSMEEAKQGEQVIQAFCDPRKVGSILPIIVFSLVFSCCTQSDNKP